MVHTIAGICLSEFVLIYLLVFIMAAQQQHTCFYFVIID